MRSGVAVVAIVALSFVTSARAQETAQVAVNAAEVRSDEAAARTSITVDPVALIFGGVSVNVERALSPDWSFAGAVEGAGFYSSAANANGEGQTWSTHFATGSLQVEAGANRYVWRHALDGLWLGARVGAIGAGFGARSAVNPDGGEGSSLGGGELVLYGQAKALVGYSATVGRLSLSVSTGLGGAYGRSVSTGVMATPTGQPGTGPNATGSRVALFPTARFGLGVAF